jgi:hypothetical protein
MARHNIEMQQTARLVNKVDVVFVVSNDEEGKLGELHLSKGGVDWLPGRSKKRYYRFTWEQLRIALEDQARERSRDE